MKNPAETEAPRRDWTRRDTIAITVVTLSGAIVRVLRANFPRGGVFDEGAYLHDACWYVSRSAARCGISQPINIEHPPLAKWLMGFGIRIFGYRPGGWRAASLVAGTLTILLTYLLARKVLRSAFGATVASGLVAIDFLHFVHSRTAMLDVFVALFGVAAILFSVYDRAPPIAEDASARPRTASMFGRRWRFAAGLAAGAAVASKWSGTPFLIAVVAMTAAWEVGRRRSTNRLGRAIAGAAREEGGSILVAFVVLPALLYAASYASLLQGSLLAWPWSKAAWVRAFFERQRYMWLYQIDAAKLAALNPYVSPGWSWPLLKRPIVYSFQVTGGRYREVLAVGSPLVWWTSLIAIATAFVRRLRKPDGGVAAVIVAGMVAGWAFWLISGSKRSYTFFYYILPAVPFMCLAVGYACTELVPSRARRAVGAVLLTASLALFTFYYPVLAAVPLRPGTWHTRLLFSEQPCGIPPISGTTSARRGFPTRSKPYFWTGPLAPPKGWCWI